MPLTNNMDRTGQARPGVDARRVDVEAIAARYVAAMARLATGGAPAAGGSRTADTAGAVAVLVVAVADVPVLIDEVRALRMGLRAARLRAANLEAAARATLGAVGDGERDPLFYLRDELGATP
jgi:hypothetical protein